MNLEKIILALLIFVLSAFSVSAVNENAAADLNIQALVLDIVLVGGVAAIYFGSVFAGGLKTAFNYVFIGIFIFAINHMIETLMFWFGVTTDTNEIIHRIIHLLGFLFLISGFYKVRQVVQASSEKKGKKIKDE